MKRDNTPWGPTPEAALTWSDSAEPYSSRFDDVYFSRDQGLAESHHVFLQGNGLPERWQRASRSGFCIAETGFGTGLNFLLTWQAWRAQGDAAPRLHFISVERYPLDAAQLQRALQLWPELRALSDELLDAWPGRLPGQHRLCFDSGRVILDLWWEDATAALSDLACRGELVDAWYLDGFAPSRNSDMWHSSVFTAMASLSRRDATVATFTAAGAVRRGLEDAGFSMRKVPGFGRKRESLVGRLRAPVSPLKTMDTPWDLDAQPAAATDSALVIGAGLAGATLASALAARGVTVTVLDRGDIAGEASGNDQGILYTRLSRRHSTLTDFALQSFLHASTYYRQLFAAGLLREGHDGSLCGSFHQQEDAEELALMQGRLQGLEDLARVLDAAGAEEHLGVTPALPGYWYPRSGWLNPPAVCHALLQAPGITVLRNCGALTLDRCTQGWQALDTTGRSLASAQVAAVCAGPDSSALAGLDWLPLQPIRGQTSHLPASTVTRKLRAALCHKGYISPARNGYHCIGASFKLRDSSAELRDAEHRENIEKLLTALPQWRSQLPLPDPAQIQGRVGLRCASPDYLPLAGAVPDRSQFLQAYAGLRKNARQVIDKRGSYVPGLYLNTAHGSRGLTSAPLCAQVLAAQICAEPPPLSRELLRALSPARFLMRDLSRNKI